MLELFGIQYLKPFTKGDKSTRLIYSTEGGPENGSQNEKMLANCLRMVDVENISKILLTFVGHRDKVTSITLHPELPIFASAGKVDIKHVFPKANGILGWTVFHLGYAIAPSSIS